MGLETAGDECADKERFVTAVAPVFRLGTGLEEGEALPLARLSPMTRTISLTETPCNSGGRFLQYKCNHHLKYKISYQLRTNLERGGGLGASLATDPSRRNQFWIADSRPTATDAKGPQEATVAASSVLDSNDASFI